MAGKDEGLPLVQSSPPQQHHSLLGLSFIAASALTFSLMSSAIKYESFSIAAMETVFWRSSIAGLINLACVWYHGVSLAVPREDWGSLAARVLVGFGSMALGFYTVSQLVLADASVIIFTSPIMSFFLGAVFLHEAIDGVNFACALTCFVGVAFVARPAWLFGSDDAQPAPALAICTGLLSAALQALDYVYVRKLKHMHFLALLHYFSLACSVGGAVAMAIAPERVTLDLGFLWVSAALTGVLGFLGQVFMMKGFQLEDVGTGSVMRYLDIVFVFIWDTVFLHEVISPWSLVGAAIIMASAITIALRRARRPPLVPVATEPPTVLMLQKQGELLPLVTPPPLPKAPFPLLGLVLISFSALTFSLMSSAIKYESYFFSAMETVFWRSLFAWCINLSFVLYYKIDLRVEAADRSNLVVRNVAGFLSMALSFWTMSQLVLADASVIIFTSPVMTFFLGALLLNEKIDIVNLVCALSCFVGVVFVSRPTLLFGDDPDADKKVVGPYAGLAVWTGLLSALMSALDYVFVRKLSGLHLLAVVHYFSLSCMVGAALAMALWPAQVSFALSWDLWLSAVASGVLGFLGQVCLTKGFQLESVGIGSVMRYLDIVFVFVWDALFLHEFISPFSLVGAAIIMTSASVICLRRARVAAPPTSP
ncbi:Drug/Metabolite Transporter (DMT) Superfamily [Achlya hypogyna]|uniref:Drug/Metabolite Transporter (DMT) Superfamily n=1 Tax=Achlya hypogyna TaxID=1202772 RepID=A0A1V9Y9G0_ACHHY|nr:Drug/Metabolite Transporter (DMT) Superfamily [Achlya hypogyna]